MKIKRINAEAKYHKNYVKQFLQETSIYNLSLLNKTKKQCLKIV